MLPLKVYVFSEQEEQTLIKMGGPGDPPFENALFQFPQSSAFRTTSRLLFKMLQPHRLFYPGLWIVQDTR